MSMSSEKREISLKAFDSDVPPWNSSRGPTASAPLKSASRVQQTQKAFFDVLLVSGETGRRDRRLQGRPADEVACRSLADHLQVAEFKAAVAARLDRAEEEDAYKGRA